MSRLLLSKIQTSISQAQISKVIFQICADIFSSLNVVTACLGNQKRICQIINMVWNSFIGISHLTLTGKGVSNLWRVGRCTDCRCKHINQNTYLIHILNFISFYNILQINISKDVLQIVCFLSFAPEPNNLRQSSVDHVVIPGIIIITIIGRIKFSKWEGIDSDFITSATELGHNVTGQKLGITSGDIHINVAHA